MVSGLKNQSVPQGVIHGFGTNMFNALTTSLPKKVEAKTIFFLIKNFHESIFENRKLGRLNFAFKDGVLYSHTIIQTGLGDIAQPSPSLGCNNTDIVRDQH